MKSYLLVLGMITNIERILSSCPQKCECDTPSLKCTGVVPTFMPKHTTEVTIYNAPYTEKFNFSHPGWGEIKKLLINPDLSEKDKAHNRVLKKQEMKMLKSLEHLQIFCPYLKDLEEDVFSDNKNLTVLDLNNNVNLGLKSIVEAIHGDSIPNLRELYLSNVSLIDAVKYGRLTFSKDFYKAVRNKPLKVLDLSKNKNSWFGVSENFYSSFPQVEKFNMAGSGFLVTSVLHLFMSHPDMTSFKNLKVIDISNQPFSSHMLSVIVGLLGDGDKSLTVYLPGKVEEIYAQNLFASKFNISGTFVSNKFCLPIEHSGKTATLCLEGQFSNLRKLVLSKNLLPFIDPYLGNSFTSLEYLGVSDNDLGQTIAQDGYLKTCLSKLKYLKHLLASTNQITVIPQDTFRNSPSLRTLDLSQNLMKAITFDTKYLTSLEKLDLSYNEIATLDATSITSLNLFLMKSRENLVKETVNFKLGLTGNPFLCACESVMFLKWLHDLNDTYVCELNHKNVTLDLQAIQNAEYMCKEHIVITVYITLAVFVVVLSAVASYMMAILCKKQKQKQRIKKTVQMFHKKVREQDKYQPPVFLSFCSHDDDAIVEHILPKLNSGLETILGIDHRIVALGVTDIRLGLPVASEVIRCIDHTSVMLFFVTKAFCKSSWCKYEVQMACLEKKPIVVMFWEEVDTKLLPVELRKFLPYLTCVTWNNVNGRLVMKPGWSKLCEIIVGLMGETETAL